MCAMNHLALIKRSPVTAPSPRSNYRVFVSAAANIITLAVAIVALVIGIVSHRDLQQSKDQVRQLQQIAATLESLPQTRDRPSPLTATQTHDAQQPRASSTAPVRSAQGLAQSAFVPPGSAVLQVAAFDREADALALATSLQQRNFPAFVLEPETDRFYRVWVGPYAAVASARVAKQQLGTQGFESIIKRGLTNAVRQSHR
jgi:hypothetical protein